MPRFLRTKGEHWILMGLKSEITGRDPANAGGGQISQGSAPRQRAAGSSLKTAERGRMSHPQG